MAEPDLFEKLGIFVRRNFLSADTCAHIRREMRESAAGPATLVRKKTVVVDEEVRRTRMVTVSAATDREITGQLSGLKPELDRHFHVELNKIQPVSFLRYRTGDFFLAHEDSAYEEDSADVLRERKVSVIVFLNSEGGHPAAERYGGGQLWFYGLMPDPRCKDLGFALSGQEGLLVAFPAHLTHEVTAVTHGERYTVVSWFC